MNATDLLGLLGETTLASSLAILVVLVLRKPLMLRLGANAAYLLWTLVPLVTIAVLLPARKGEIATLLAHAVSGEVRSLAAPLADSAVGMPWWVAVAWIVGVVAMLLLQGWRQWRYVRGLGALQLRGGNLYASQSGHGLPALVGVLVPRVVLPADFDIRYSEQERQLVLHHEDVHMRRGDLKVNAVVVLLRCLYWFNPLVHHAARRFRQDQELACDQAVIARFPRQRRAYAGAMLKTQLAARELPLGCHWSTHQTLKERIVMLKRPVVSRQRRLAGASIALVFGIGAAAFAWAAQPGTTPASPGATSTEVRVRQMSPPRYPATAVEQKVAGRVLLKILVGTDGKAKQVLVEKSNPQGVFDEATVNAAKLWTFEPQMRDGRAVEGWIMVPVDFSLDGPPGDAVSTGARNIHRGLATA